ncbi:hypothetical protein BN946_scf184817.g9 [Trametes cinnabarina]|uniref:Nephrocystin 3-like N-terminal domain-containing protein n=1 Tax=Pycnoporus cinnabarinus TaxID=5643 RepID=A0A060SAZ0_PYCCI|nr:hypothetical protein BN946_scf184817.g9 [Trametes cinnabarina]
MDGSGESQGRDIIKATANAVLIVLKAIKEGSPACPPLQGAVGALLVVVEAYQKFSSAADGVKTLQAHIVNLEQAIKRLIPTDYAKCPDALKKRFEDFARSKVQSVADSARKLQSQGLAARLLNASDNAEATESYSLTASQLEGTIAVELNVYEMAQDVRQGFNTMDHRFDKVDQGIESVRGDISQLATDPIRSALRPVFQARFDYGLSVHVRCDADTRREVLAAICSWFRPNDPRLATLPRPLPLSDPITDSSILWIHALAGAGKSTLAQTVAEWWDEDQVLGASFFCARDGERSNILSIFRTIAYQLACRFPWFHDALIRVVKADLDIYSSLPSRQLQKLIVEPLQAARSEKKLPDNACIVVVIDALDECTDSDAVSTILKSLSLYISNLTPLKFVITSRPEENIARGFLLQTLLATTQNLSLTDIPDALAKRDVSNFFRRRFAEIRGRYSLGVGWPSDSHFDKLLLLSEGLFIYATTAILYVGDDRIRDPEGQLASLLESGSAAAAAISTIGSGSTSPLWRLDALYEQVLQKAAEKLGTSLQARLKAILGTIILAEERLKPMSVEDLLRFPSGDLRRILPVLNAVLITPVADDEHTPIRLIHLSFSNFLVDPSRCKSSDFLITPHLQHTFIALRCLETMQSSLKHNVCEIDSSHDHLFNIDIPGLSEAVARFLPPALQYACKYWSSHLCRAELGQELLSALDKFCNNHLLHWLEALSLMDSVEIAVEALQSAQRLLQVPTIPSTDVPALLNECERITRAFYPAIAASFFQVYKSALAFSPASSLLRRRYSTEVLNVVRICVGLDRTWSSALSTTVADDRSLRSVGFSQDGKYVVSGGDDNKIRLWKTQTGKELRTFEGHLGAITSVSFSPTGREILSGSSDKTVKLWDVVTGACLRTWQPRSSGQLILVAWSLDGTLIASGCDEGKVFVWSVASSEAPTGLGWHHDRVRGLVFTLDRTLLSASDDKTCNMWDTHRAKLLRSLKHTSRVRCVAVSPDNRLVACGVEQDEIAIWTRADGRRLFSLKCPSDPRSLAFFSNDILASAHVEGELCILWNVPRKVPLELLNDVESSSVAFSPDCTHVAAGTSDAHGKPPPPLIRLGRDFVHPTKLSEAVLREDKQGDPNRSGPLSSVAISPTGQLLLVHVEAAKKTRLYDISKGRYTHTIKHGRISGCFSIAWSPAGNFIASGGYDGTVCVWDSRTGRCIRTYAEQTSCVKAVVFTPDEQQVISASYCGTIRRFHIHKSMSEELFRCDGALTALALSSSQRWMLSATSDLFPPGTSNLDLLAGPSQQPHKQYGVHATLRLHDASGRVVWMENYQGRVASLAFSEDCSRVLAGNEEGETFLYDLTQLILVYDSTTHPAQPPLVPGHRFHSGSTRPVKQISFSHDGRYIVTERSYTPLSPELRPPREGGPHSSLLPAYCLDSDGWLWCINTDSEPRRICWVSPKLRPQNYGHRLSQWSVVGHTIAIIATDGRLVIIDASCC